MTQPGVGGWFSGSTEPKISSWEEELWAEVDGTDPVSVWCQLKPLTPTFPSSRVLYGIIPRSTAAYRKHTALGHPTTRASLRLSPPSLTGVEAQVAFEARSMGFSPCSGALLSPDFR